MFDLLSRTDKNREYSGKFEVNLRSDQVLNVLVYQTLSNVTNELQPFAPFNNINHYWINHTK
jgi:hypothetical protein